MDILKTIIPAAGKGARFAPYTTVIPKEMLPILNRPAIHYALEEVLLSGIESLFMVTSKKKECMVDYLEQAAGKHESRFHIGYVRQNEPRGLGDAVRLARPLIGKEYFTVLLPDDLIFSDQPGLLQLMRVARQERASVIAVQEVAPELVSNYGIVAIKKQITPNLFQVSHLVEKPQAHTAPSNLAVVGRYVLSHKIFAALDEVDQYSDAEELQLTDAITTMMRNNERVFAYKLHGTRYDIGTPAGWLNANIGIGLTTPSIAQSILPYHQPSLRNLTT